MGKPRRGKSQDRGFRRPPAGTPLRMDGGAARQRFDDHGSERDRFAEYARTGNRALRDALVLEYCDLARTLARRYRGRGEATDDLEQVAMLGLVKAIDRFDPSREI